MPVQMCDYSNRFCEWNWNRQPEDQLSEKGKSEDELICDFSSGDPSNPVSFFPSGDTIWYEREVIWENPALCLKETCIAISLGLFSLESFDGLAFSYSERTMNEENISKHGFFPILQQEHTYHQEILQFRLRNRVLPLSPTPYSRKDRSESTLWVNDSVR